jgi:ribonuclease VapC
MFVDACAIVSIIAGEDSAVAYERALAGASEAFTSPMAAWEAIIVLSRPDQLNCRYQQAEQVVVEWLAARNIALRDPAAPLRILAHAVAVAERHGVGKRALSNFDCFHYAYAKAAGCSLLTSDKLLRETDVDCAP